MIIDKIIVVFISIILLVALIIRYIKRYAPENLILVPLLTFFITLYIAFTIYDVNIPIFLQIPIFVFSVFIPIIAVYLQYNNIILTRKILYLKMNFCFKAEDYKKTIGYIEKLVLLEGRKSTSMYILGKCYKALGDFINARDSFYLAIEIDPKDYKSYYELGIILDETNKKELALSMYDSALKIKPDYYEANEALGISLTSQGRFEDAVNVYYNAIKLYPNSYEIYYNIAMIESELGNYDSAIEAFKKAGEIKPDLYMAHYNLGKLYFSKGELDNAIDAYSKILNSTNYGPKGYYQIAIIYSQKKEYTKAMTSLEYAMELDLKYVEKADREYAFNPFRGLIEDYKKSKENERLEQIQKHNFMRHKLKIFNKKENDVLVFNENLTDYDDYDYSKDYSKNDNEEYSNDVRNHA